MHMYIFYLFIHKNIIMHKSIIKVVLIITLCLPLYTNLLLQLRHTYSMVLFYHETIVLKSNTMYSAVAVMWL